MLELLKNHEFIENDIDIRKRIAQLKHNLKELKK